MSGRERRFMDGLSRLGAGLLVEGAVGDPAGHPSRLLSPLLTMPPLGPPVRGRLVDPWSGTAVPVRAEDDHAAPSVARAAMEMGLKNTFAPLAAARHGHAESATSSDARRVARVADARAQVATSDAPRDPGAASFGARGAPQVVPQPRYGRAATASVARVEPSLLSVDLPDGEATSSITHRMATSSASTGKTPTAQAERRTRQGLPTTEGTGMAASQDPGVQRSWRTAQVEHTRQSLPTTERTGMGASQDPVVQQLWEVARARRPRAESGPSLLGTEALAFAAQEHRGETHLPPVRRREAQTPTPSSARVEKDSRSGATSPHAAPPQPRARRASPDSAPRQALPTMTGVKREQEAHGPTHELRDLITKTVRTELAQRGPERTNERAASQPAATSSAPPEEIERLLERRTRRSRRRTGRVERGKR